MTIQGIKIPRILARDLSLKQPRWLANPDGNLCYCHGMQPSTFRKECEGIVLKYSNLGYALRRLRFSPKIKYRAKCYNKLQGIYLQLDGDDYNKYGYPRRILTREIKTDVLIKRHPNK